MDKEVKEKKVQRLSKRGIETLCRNVLRTQLELTAIADNKAALMISINGLIISLVVIFASAFLHTNEFIAIPLIMWLSFSLAAMTFAILSATPHYGIRDLRDKRDFFEKQGNILYFSDMSKLCKDEYVETVFEVLRDQETIYEQIFAHSYALANSLSRKYRLLKWSYSVFIAGLFLSVLAFMIMIFLVPAGKGPTFTDMTTKSNIAPLSPLANTFVKFDTKEASGIRQLPDKRIAVVSDEKKKFLELFQIDEFGELSEIKMDNTKSINSRLERIRDVEAIAVDDNGSIFAISSHSFLKNGNRSLAREKLVRLTLSHASITQVQETASLRSSILNSLSSSFERLSFHKGSELNIEALCFSESKKELLIGLRTPLIDGKAPILKIINPHAIFSMNEEPRIELVEAIDLNNAGIRDMAYSKRLGGFILIANKEKLGLFGATPLPSLWLWNPDEKPRKLNLSKVLKNLGNIEGISELQLGNSKALIVVQDRDKKASRYLIIPYDHVS